MLAWSFDPKRPPPEMRFQIGRDSSVRIVDPDGKPIPEMFVALPCGHGHTYAQDKDGRFRIETAGGVITAPADVYPTNPLSADIAQANTVMGTTRGLVVPVAVEAGPAETVELDEDRIGSAWRFKLSPLGDPGEMPFPQEAWFDGDGIPVMFAVYKKGKRIAFVLTNYDEVLAGRSP